MLGHRYRFSVNNQTGTTIDVTIKARLWKRTSSGLAYSTEQTLYAKTGIASGSGTWTTDTAIDNSADLYEGADLTVIVAFSGTATGTVEIRVQKSTDAGTTWPDDGQGIFAALKSYSGATGTAKFNVDFPGD